MHNCRENLCSLDERYHSLNVSYTVTLLLSISFRSIILLAPDSHFSGKLLLSTTYLYWKETLLGQTNLNFHTCPSFQLILALNSVQLPSSMRSPTRHSYCPNLVMYLILKSICTCSCICRKLLGREKLSKNEWLCYGLSLYEFIL